MHKQVIQDKVYKFFIDSEDFNGIPLRKISEDLGIDYKGSIDLIKELVEMDKITLQSSTIPHIIHSRLYPIDIQLKILEDAKSWTVSEEKMGILTFVSESTDYPICLYPSPRFLRETRNLDEFGDAVYTKRLALAEPHISPIFFEIDVLERYANDPRFDFHFKDYSGRISYRNDVNEEPLVRKEDRVFLKTFGLGIDSNEKRVAVVYLRYLCDLTPEHQMYWKSKESIGDCQMLEEYYRNTILGDWTSSYSIFSGFIGELTCLNEISELIFSKPLFRKNFDEEKRPREFTFFFTPTLKNSNDFVLLLDKMLSDNINKNFFEGKVDLYILEEIEGGIVERKPKGTITLFEEWLIGVFTAKEEELKELFKPLKTIRRERQNPAHRISENEYDEKYIELQKKIISDAYSSIKSLRYIFQQHPLAEDYQVPNWLETGTVKLF